MGDTVAGVVNPLSDVIGGESLESVVSDQVNNVINEQLGNSELADQINTSE